ncbi:MAG: winged helix-turn-helix domain-containing protein [Candidatus Thiodiazotropha sp.]
MAFLDCHAGGVGAGHRPHRGHPDRTVDTHVKNLRKKLNAVTPDEEIIRSIYGVGYKLELPP